MAVVETALFRITTERIDPEAVRSLVEHDGAGAIVLFHGVVRNRALSGRQVTHLDYEAYPEMAEEKMSEIGREIKERYDVKQVAIVHRVGRLALGEASACVDWRVYRCIEREAQKRIRSQRIRYRQAQRDSSHLEERKNRAGRPELGGVKMSF